jgi:hypothetical protein
MGPRCSPGRQIRRVSGGCEVGVRWGKEMYLEEVDEEGSVWDVLVDVDVEGGAEHRVDEEHF